MSTTGTTKSLREKLLSEDLESSLLAPGDKKDKNLNAISSGPHKDSPKAVLCGSDFFFIVRCREEAAAAAAVAAGWWGLPAAGRDFFSAADAGVDLSILSVMVVVGAGPVDGPT